MGGRRWKSSARLTGMAHLLNVLDSMRFMNELFLSTSLLESPHRFQKQGANLSQSHIIQRHYFLLLSLISIVITESHRHRSSSMSLLLSLQLSFRLFLVRSGIAKYKTVTIKPTILTYNNTRRLKRAAAERLFYVWQHDLKMYLRFRFSLSQNIT